MRLLAFPADVLSAAGMLHANSANTMVQDAGATKAQMRNVSNS